MTYKCVFEKIYNIINQVFKIMQMSLIMPFETNFANNNVGEERDYASVRELNEINMSLALSVTENGLRLINEAMSRFDIEINTNSFNSLSRCTCIYCRLSEPINFTTKNKAIDKNKNTECPITYESLKYKQEYLCCGTCKYNFVVDSILTYWKNNSDVRNCPMCRSKWTDYCKYVNVHQNMSNDELKFKKFHNNKLHESMFEVDNKQKLTKSRYNKRNYYVR